MSDEHKDEIAAMVGRLVDLAVVDGAFRGTRCGRWLDRSWPQPRRCRLVSSRCRCHRRRQGQGSRNESRSGPPPPLPRRSPAPLRAARTPARADARAPVGVAEAHAGRIEYPRWADADTGIDLDALGERCLAKAAARWAAGRRRGRGKEAEPEDREVVAWAERLVESATVGAAAGGSWSTGLTRLDELAGNFETMAAAAALSAGVDDPPGGRASRLEPVLKLFAEAQSALRAASLKFGVENEPEQAQAFAWLREMAARRRVYLPRFMRVDDPADPTQWPDLLARIRAAGLGQGSKAVKAPVRAPGPTAEASPPPEPTADVKQVRRLLAGRTAVLIGGDCRPGAKRLLESALGLKELIWIETREHQSVTPFEPAIARPEVALVLLAIRWSSHAFGDVKLFCDRHSKPLVRLPAGYNPNQVAAQVLAQCSGQLSEE